MDAKIAWRNIWRNPRRSILTMAAIAFATLLLVFMLSMQFGSYDTMINASVKIQTGHLQVQAEGYNQKREIRRVVPEPDKVGLILADIPDIAAFTNRAEAFALVSSDQRTYSAMVIGIDPEREAAVSSLAHMIRKGDYLKNDDDPQALIGWLLAQNLKVDQGEELVLLGQGRDGSIAAGVLGVAGIFNSGQDEFDRSIILVPLAYFQQTFSMAGGVHKVVAICTSLDAVAETKAEIEQALADPKWPAELVALDWKDLMPGLIQAIQLDLISGFIFYLILIVVVAFSILNTFLMAIFERTREFGVMMAIGTPPGRLTRLLLLESAAMTLVGAGVGIIAGCLVTGYFQAHGLLIPGIEELARQYGLPDRIYPQLSTLSVGIGTGIVMVITLLTAFYPALRVRRFTPVEALQSN